jgi:hypothetical protein
VGSLDVTTFPTPSPATHNDAEGHETLSADESMWNALHER